MKSDFPFDEDPIDQIEGLLTKAVQLFSFFMRLLSRNDRVQERDLFLDDEDLSWFIYTFCNRSRRSSVVIEEIKDDLSDNQKSQQLIIQPSLMIEKIKESSNQKSNTEIISYSSVLRFDPFIRLIMYYLFLLNIQLSAQTRLPLAPKSVGIGKKLVSM